MQMDAEGKDLSAKISEICGMLFCPRITQINAEGKRFICENQRDLREILLSRGLRRSTQKEKIYLRKSARSAGDFIVPRITQINAE
jgi:hypothetical protein